MKMELVETEREQRTCSYGASKLNGDTWRKTLLRGNSLPRSAPAILATLDECTNILSVDEHTLKRAAGNVASTCRSSASFSDINDLDPSRMSDYTEVFDDRDTNERGDHETREDNSPWKIIMKKLKKEVEGLGTSKVLTEKLKTLSTQESGEEQFEEGEKFRRIAEDLRKTIDGKKSVSEMHNSMLEELAEMERRTLQGKLVADAELRYITAWERARCEQIRLSQNMEIEELRKALEDYRIREANERRVYDEKTNFMTRRIASIEKKIAEWRVRHDQQRMKYRKDIWSLQVEIDEKQKSLTQLKAEHRRNQEFIDAYQAEQEARRKRSALEEHMRRSAIRIQAWWRGLMVRRKLGPYRPEEKKKKRTAKTKK